MTSLPCAIYTRKSSEEGLEQGFNSLDAQREACQAFILSQKAQGWRAAGAYDDGGYSGGNVERPALQRLLTDIASRRVKVVVVYKVDRLTRSLADFAKLVELFDAHGVSFVSVTQQFNTTSSMGRLTLNVLLSFAQFEREVTGERIRDKIAASKRKGMWMGGFAPLGYRPHERSLVVDEPQAKRVREIFQLYLSLGCVRRLKGELDGRAWVTPPREGSRPGGGKPFSRGHLYRILSNAIYIGHIVHKGQSFPGQHPAIVDRAVWRDVQARLAENAQGHSLRSGAQEPSLLNGLVFDDSGRRMQPSHTTKGTKRYRYYFRPADEGDAQALRVSATELESTVVRAVQDWLNDDAKVLDAMPSIGAADASEAMGIAIRLATQLMSNSRQEKSLVVTRLVRRILFRPTSITIELRLRELFDAGAIEEAVASIEVPIQLKRCGPAVRLVVHGQSQSDKPSPDPRLIRLLSKARRWFKDLASGAHPSVLSLAREHGLASSDVTQVIYLAFLAPDLVQRIVDGHQPVGLGTKRLLSMTPLPLDWDEQRRLFASVS